MAFGAEPAELPPPAASLMPDPGLPGAGRGRARAAPGHRIDVREHDAGGCTSAPPAQLGRGPRPWTTRCSPRRPSRRRRRAVACAAALIVPGRRQPRPGRRPNCLAPAVLANHFLPPTEEGAPGSTDSGFLLMLNGGAEAPAAEAPTKPAVIIPGRPAGESPALPSGCGPAGGAPAQGRAERRGRRSPRSRPKVVLLAAGGGWCWRRRRSRCWCCPTWARDRRSPRRWAGFRRTSPRDHFPAYKQAVETLKGAAGDAKAPALRGAAAELQLLALLARGADKATEKAAVGRAGAGAGGCPHGRRRPARGGARPGAAGPGPRPRRGRRDRAGRAGEHARRAADHRPAPLARAQARSGHQAAAGGVAGDAARVLAHYLLGRALEDGGKQAEARAAYAKTLAANPQHAGALVGQARLQPAKPGERRKAAEALVVKIGGVGSPTEVAEAQVLLGEALLALGRSPEAVAVLTKAVAAYPQGASGQRALVEALLADGHAADALARLRAADPTHADQPGGPHRHGRGAGGQRPGGRGHGPAGGGRRPVGPEPARALLAGHRRRIAPARPIPPPPPSTTGGRWRSIRCSCRRRCGWRRCCRSRASPRKRCS